MPLSGNPARFFRAKLDIRFISVLATALLFFISGAIHAQLRTIPPDAKRADIRYAQEMQVVINGQPMTLAPGTLIRDTFNRLILPNALPAGASIKYLVDRDGRPWRIWILTPAELAAPDKAP